MGLSIESLPETVNIAAGASSRLNQSRVTVSNAHCLKRYAPSNSYVWNFVNFQKKIGVRTITAKSNQNIRQGRKQNKLQPLSRTKFEYRELSDTSPICLNKKSPKVSIRHILMAMAMAGAREDQAMASMIATEALAVFDNSRRDECCQTGPKPPLHLWKGKFRLLLAVALPSRAQAQAIARAQGTMMYFAQQLQEQAR